MTFDYLKKLLLSDNSRQEIINNEDAIFKLIPELESCKDFNQKNKRWHPYDVYNHILYTIDGIENDLLLRIAALFHDMGKPIVMIEDENGIGHFPNHNIESLKIFCKYASSFNLKEEQIQIIFKLIYYHDYRLEKMNDDEIKSFLSHFTHDELIMLYKLKIADNNAQSMEAHNLIPLLEKQQEEVLKIIK